MPTMQTQVAVNYNVANRPRSPADALLNPPEKTRGFLSFLTWPFILAQLFWVEHVLGDGMRPAPAADLTDTHDLNANNHPKGDDGNGSSPQPFTKSVVDLPVQQDDGPGSHAILGGATPVAVSAEYLRPKPDSAITGQHPADLLDIGGAGGGGNSPVVAHADFSSLENPDGAAGNQPGLSVFDDLFGHTGSQSSASPQIVTDMVESHSVNPTIGELLTQIQPGVGAPTVEMSPIVHIIGDTVSLVDAAPPALVTTTAPVVYSVDHLVGDVGSFLDLAPTTFAATTDAVTNTADQVVSTAVPVVEAVPTILASATDLGVNAAGHAVSDVGSLVDLAPMTLAPTTDAITNTADQVVSTAVPVVEAVPTILASATALTSTIDDSSTSHLADTGTSVPVITDSVLSTAPATALDASSSASGLSGHDAGFLGSPGTISIVEPAPSPTAPDQLFSAGQYTVYGVTLSTDATTTTNNTPLDHGAGDVTNILDLHATTDNTHNQTTVADSHDLVAGLSHTSSHVGDGML